MNTGQEDLVVLMNSDGGISSNNQKIFGLTKDAFDACSIVPRTNQNTTDTHKDRLSCSKKNLRRSKASKHSMKDDKRSCCSSKNTASTYSVGTYKTKKASPTPTVTSTKSAGYDDCYRSPEVTCSIVYVAGASPPAFQVAERTVLFENFVDLPMNVLLPDL